MIKLLKRKETFVILNTLCVFFSPCKTNVVVKTNVANVNTGQRDEIRVAVQVGSESELNSWPDSSVG